MDLLQENQVKYLVKGGFLNLGIYLDWLYKYSPHRQHLVCGAQEYIVSAAQGSRHERSRWESLIVTTSSGRQRKMGNRFAARNPLSSGRRLNFTVHEDWAYFHSKSSMIKCSTNENVFLFPHEFRFIGSAAKLQWIVTIINYYLLFCLRKNSNS